METVRASIMWPGLDINVLTVFVEPTPELWAADPTDDEILIFWAVDEDERETGEVAGVRIIGFLEFDRWHELPELPLLWQLPGQEPLPLKDLLQREQRLLRGELAMAAGRQRAAT